MISERPIPPEDNTDLNALTEEQHAQRLEDHLARFWALQTQEMFALPIGTEQVI